MWDTQDAREGRLREVYDQPISPGRQTGNPQEIRDVDFASDGRRLATSTAHGNTRIRDLATGQAVSSFGNLTHRTNNSSSEMRTHAITSIRFSLDGQLLVTASEDGRALVWDTATGARLHELKHGGRVACARFSRRVGARLVTASWDQTVRIWDAQTGRELARLSHPDEVGWADFDPTGRWVATACKDQKVRIWSADNGNNLATLSHAEPPPDAYPLDFNGDGTWLVTAAGDVFRVWSVPDGKPVTPAIKHGGPIRSVRFSPKPTRAGGWHLVTAGADGTARIWDAATGHPLSEPLRHDGAVTYAEFSPDGRQLLTSSWDQTVRLWPVIPAPATASEWLPKLAEALAGQRLDDKNASQAVPVENLFQLRQQLQAGTDADYYARWARWFFSDRQGRTAIGGFVPEALDDFANKGVDQRPPRRRRGELTHKGSRDCRPIRGRRRDQSSTTPRMASLIFETVAGSKRPRRSVNS